MQETPDSSPAAGLGVTDQDVPFHCSMSVLPLAAPTATQNEDEVHETASRTLELGAGFHMLLLHGIAGIDCEDRLDLQILTPLEEFEQTHAVGGVVVPGADVGRTIDPWADGLLPLEAFGDVVAFQIIAARQPQELWAHGSQLLHQVGAQPVGAIMVGRREDRD